LQRLQDLQHHHENNIIYRIGTVVLHNDLSRHEIVDGQQRLITLSLIVYALTGKQNGLLAEKLNHRPPRNTMWYNSYQFNL
ncbi:GmrSD restriction endonuclease domain-containing protein, partial [Kingella kingae]|uniref:GmrSD restriction endonuclease domain-containing protein n=1 Tax=Kingella kingae TaxID=504 RepID=UPI001EE33134